MDLDIALKNYRCFPDESPARISLRKGCTAFVGVNNSGKSSLLKFFYEFRQLFNSLSPANLWRALSGQPVGFSRQASVMDDDELFCDTNARDLRIEFEFRADVPGTATKEVRVRLVIIIVRGTRNFTATLHILEGRNAGKSPDSINGTIVASPAGALVDLKGFFETCQLLTRTLYIGAFRNAINTGGSPYYDIKVGQDFVRQWAEYKVGHVRNDNLAANRLTDEIRGVFGFKSLEINAAQDYATLKVSVNGRPHRLEELGSGLAQFIIALINVATRNPSYVLIDEPEISLHPRLQSDFLTALELYASEGVLFATHNLGLARARADRIYSVRKIAEGKSEVKALEATPRLSELLGELSFSSYRELGFDKVLLVEGPTDIKTFQQLLRKYDKEHQIVCLSLGGNDLIGGDRELELAEIQRITPHVCAVIDSERDGPKAELSSRRSEFVTTCQNLNISYKVLERRATENYFSDRAVKAVRGDKYKALGLYDKLEEASPGWGKPENWRIAREMTREELDATDLGEVLRNL